MSVPRTRALAHGPLALLMVGAMCVRAATVATGAAPQGAGTVCFVDGNATGLNDGTSWSNAFTHLQDALVTASEEIWVAAGTYRPEGPKGDRSASFPLRSGQALYGGFGGGETHRNQRNPDVWLTCLSGDLNGDDGADGVNTAENSYHVLTASQVDASARVDGFLITGGHSDADGGGVWLRNAAPTFVHCRISTNWALFGGGMSLVDSTPVITNCVFSDNVAWSGRGGAIYTQASVPMTVAIQDCQFLRNQAWVNSGPGDAGAIWGSFNCALDLSGCLFEQNEARWRFAGGNMAAVGGAIAMLGDDSRINRCVFRQNRAHIGGALWLGANGTIANSLFVGNEAYRVSSGPYDYGGFAGALYIAIRNTNLIVGCTFHANHARSTGGIWTESGTATTIANCILWSNTSTETQAKPLDDQLSGGTRPVYSCVRDLFTPEPGEDPPEPAKFPGCITNAPLFVRERGLDNVAGTADDDVRLQATSPCLDAGSNARLPAWATTDLSAWPRRLDSPSPDTGEGSAPLTDMGAYEYLASLVADLHPWDDGGYRLSWTALGMGWRYRVEQRGLVGAGEWQPVVSDLTVPEYAFPAGSLASNTFIRVRGDFSLP